MALDSRRRAKQLAKKVAKEKARHDRKRKMGLLGHMPGMAQLSLAQVHEALMPAGLFESGLGNVVLSRKLGNTIWVGAFLVDTFCLGVKDAFLTTRTEAEYIRMVVGMRERQHLIPIHPSCARKLVEGTVAYAHDLGFSPHKGYHKARRVFGDIDPDSCPTSFDFGDNGKPTFISGPYDSETRRQQIITQLTERCGPEGFHFIMPMETEDFQDFYEDEFDEEEPEDR